MMLATNQDISTHRYFGDNDDDENSSSSQSPPSNQQDNNNYFFSYGRSSSIISQQNNHKHHSNHSNNHHTYKVLVSGGGFAGLVFSYYLLHSLSHKHENLPIEITIVEKASMYRQVGAIITLEGEQVIRALKEMNLEEELHQIEIPRSKQNFYTKNGRHVRSFDESSVTKYKEEGRRYERHKFHEILMKRIKPLIVRREGNLTILSNANLHSNSSTPSSEDELSDDKHFKMNRVIYSMRPSLFNKEKIEVTLMNKNDWLHLQYQKEHQENIQMKRSSSICGNSSPINNQRILNDISTLEKKDTPTNRLSKLHKRRSTGSSGDLQQMEEEAMRQSSTTTPAEIATPNSAGKESAGWRRFFQKKESNAQSPSQKTKSDSSSNILLEGSPMSAPLNTINDPKRTSMNDLLVTFNDGDSFESSVYQSTEDRKLYQIEREEYDLVVGSDGIHSQTRALIFGDESNFKHFLGVGYFCFIVDMILTEADEQQVSEKYWNNVYGSEKKSTESFDPTQISGIKGLEPLTPDRIAKMKEVSKKLAELIKDGESSSVLLNHGRYMNVLRYGNKLSVSLVYRQPKEEEMLKESSNYTVSKSKSFVDDSLLDSTNDSKSSPSTQEKWRKRFSLFRKHTESPIKNDLAQDPSSSASSLTNHFYSFDINKFEDHHDHDDQRSVTHSSDSSEDHEEVMEEEDEEIAEAFMEMVNESMANRESTTSAHSLEEKCTTPNTNSSSPTSSEEKASTDKSEKKQKKKKEKSHHSKTFFIAAENRKNFLKNKFEDCGYLFHDIMDLVFDSRIIYYDDLAQIRNLDQWYKGKCVLVGDSCQACTPLSGKGGALAIIAAKTLALELRNVLETHASTEGEDNLHTIPLEKSIYFDSCLQQAFENYENAMQERIKTVQKKTVWEGVDVYLAKSGVKRMVRDGALKFLPKSVLLKMTKKEEEQGSTIIVKK